MATEKMAAVNTGHEVNKNGCGEAHDMTLKKMAAVKTATVNT